MPLTELEIRSAKPGLKPLKDPKGNRIKGPDGRPIFEATDKPYKLSDEKGLYLEVSPAGGRLWRFKYRFAGKEKRLALGAFPEIGLKAARDGRDEARRLLAQGIDPGHNKKVQSAAKALRAANSFEAVAREWFAKQSPNWAASHASKILQRLEKDVFPWLGERPIADITAPELLTVPPTTGPNF